MVSGNRYPEKSIAQKSNMVRDECVCISRQEACNQYTQKALAANGCQSKGIRSSLMMSDGVIIWLLSFDSLVVTSEASDPGS
jgi:hypothetical protein